MATMQSVIDRARLDLNDADKVRHPDANLLVFANEFLKEASKLRPDWFFPNEPPDGSLALGGTFPIPERYVITCANYIIARANLLGTEESRFDAAAAYLRMATGA